MKSVGCGNKRNKRNSEILGKDREGPSKSGKNTEKILFSGSGRPATGPDVK